MDLRGLVCGLGRLQAVSQAWGSGEDPPGTPRLVKSRLLAPPPRPGGVGLRVPISNRLQVALLLVGRAGFGLRWQADPSAEGGVLGGEGEDRKSISWLRLSVTRVTACDPQPPCLTCLPGGTSLSFLVLVTGCTSVGRIPEAEIYKITATDFYPLQEEAKEEDRLAALRLKKFKKKKKKEEGKKLHYHSARD